MDLARLLVVLFAVLGWSASAARADDTKFLHESAILGGGGGGEFYELCPNGAVLSGVNVTVGKDMNSISPVCQWVSNGGGTTDTFFLGTYGNAHDAAGFANCAPNFVQGMWVGTS